MAQNYIIREKNRISTDATKILGRIYTQEGLRPRVGTQLLIKNTVYKVVGSVPPDNPARGQVTYFVERFNPNAPFRRGINPRDARGLRRTR